MSTPRGCRPPDAGSDPRRLSGALHRRFRPLKLGSTAWRRSTRFFPPRAQGARTMFEPASPVDSASPVCPRACRSSPAGDHQFDREAVAPDGAGPRALADDAARAPGASTPDAAHRAVPGADPRAGPAKRHADHPRHHASDRRWRWRWRRWPSDEVELRHEASSPPFQVVSKAPAVVGRSAEFVAPVR